MTLRNAFDIAPSPCAGCLRDGDCDRLCARWRLWFRKHWARVCAGLRELDRLLEEEA